LGACIRPPLPLFCALVFPSLTKRAPFRSGRVQFTVQTKFIHLTKKKPYPMETENSNLTNSQIRKWWSERRLLYNFGLVVSGITAFILYVILGETLIMPRDPEFEITFSTIFFQGIGYLVMMVFANLFYFLGAKHDIYFNKENSHKFRINLFNLGFWFSVSLPFTVPLMIVISSFFNYY
jgi:hypothetical protein